MLAVASTQDKLIHRGRNVPRTSHCRAPISKGREGIGAGLSHRGLPRWLSGEASTCQCRRHGFDSWVRKIPWRRKWQSTLVFLPGTSHGQRSLEGYSPWDQKKKSKRQN